MHGIGNGGAFCGSGPNSALVQMGDASVKELVTTIKHSKAWKEGNNAIVETNYGVKGVQSNQAYNHFALLKTLEAGFGLPCLNHACDANVKVMSDMFKRVDQH